MNTPTKETTDLLELDSAAIDVGIIGTQNPKHLLNNIDMYEECLEMPKEVVNELNKRFDKFGKNWDQRT